MRGIPQWRSVLAWAALLAVVLPAHGQQPDLSTVPQAVRAPSQSRWPRALRSTHRTFSPPLSSYECVVEDGKSEHRVCIFKDIVLWEGQLHYVAHGEVDLPDIDINWLEPERLDIQVIQQNDALNAWSTAQVEHVSKALLGHHVNYANFYHIFIETLPTWHNIMCKYWAMCTYDEHSKLQLWLLEERGSHLTDLTSHLPALKPLYTCLSPTPPRHIQEHNNYGKVVVFEAALAGMGPDVRAFHQWRPRFFDNFVTSPADMMHSWRRRLAQCLDAPFDTATASQSPLTVTIVDRVYKAGRHILNIRELQARVLAKWPGSVVQVVHVEGLNLNQQIAVFQHTSILIWTHGAAMADLLFLPQGASAIELVPWPHADQAHEWAQSIQSDFGLHIQVTWTRLTDGSHLHSHTEVLTKEAAWQALKAEDKLLFLEKGECPGNPNTPLNLLCRNEWMHYHTSFVQPWEPLEALLDTAYNYVQNQSFLTAQ